MLSRTARRALTVLLGISLPVVGLTVMGGTTAHAAGTSIFTESFKNNSVPDPHWIVGGSNFTPCLTATGNSTVTPIKSCAGTADAAGSGAVRLTSAANNQSGFLFYNSPLPDTAGIDVTFDAYQYSGTGADGIAFFMTDGQYQLLTPGQAGGYLGYAGGNHGIGVGNGVAHGLFGLGLDAYGNFSNFENDPNCGGGYTPSFVKDAVVLRGPGNADQLNYCYLAGAKAAKTLHVDAATDRTHGGANDVVRHVHIVVDPSSDATPRVTVSIDGAQVLQAAEPAMSPTVKFGWTASTGGSTNIHEIQNVTVTTINPLGPSLSVSNTVNNGGTFASGGGAAGDAAYTITNGAGANFETQPFTLTVPVPAGLGFTGTTVSDPNMVCRASTATQLSCTYTPTGYGFAPAQAVTAHLLFSPTATYSHKDLVVTASVSSPDGGSPTANQTLQITPRAVPSPITTTVNVPATVAQGANGTAAFTWLLGPAANPALVSSTTVDASGNLTMTPVPGASGTTTIPLSVQDASGLTSPTVNVPVTVRPTVSAVVGSGTGPAPVYGNVPAPVGTGPFTYTFATTPNAGTQGTAQFVAGSPEQVKFTPVQGFSGAVPTFTYKVTDAGGAQSATATIDLTVNKPAAPTVVAVSGTIDANTTFTQTVPAPNGASPFGYAITTPPVAGTETISNAGVVNFTPPDNASGVYSSTYQAQDQYGQTSNNGQIQVTVRPVAANFSGSANGTSTITLGAPAPAGTGPFTWVAAPPQTNGTLSMDVASGTVTFTANLGYSGTFSFPYSVSDGVGTSSTARSVTITVLAPPAPVGVTYSSTQNADTAVSAQLPLPSSGTGPFTYSVVTPPASGVLVLQPGGHIAYTPAAGTSGIVTFTYQVTDPYGSTSLPVTVTLNFRPVAPPLSGSTVGPQPVTIAGGSVDGTGPFTYALTQPPAAQGSATVNQANGAITFTPTLGYSGTASFSYTVTGAGPTTSLSAPVTVTVSPPPAPVANGVSGSTVSGGSTTVIGSTSSGVGPFTYAISLPPGHGTAFVGGGSLLDYTSTAPYSGVDAFTYTVTDPYGTTSAPAVVIITVHPIAASPVNGSSIGPNPVVATPAAPTGTGPFTYNLVSGGLPPTAQGTTTENSSTGQITFTPVSTFTGTVTFQYTVSDANGLTSAPGTVNFTVNKPAGPGVSPASATTPANTALDISPPAATGTAPLTFLITSPPTLGAATISAAGVIHYTPNLNVSGTDTLQFTATDPYGTTSAAAVVTVSVTPTVQGVTATMVANTVLLLPTPGPVGTGPFSYSVTSPSHGTAAISGSGALTYTPVHNFGGTDAFTYRATHASGQHSNPGSVTITVTKPAAPTVGDVSATTTVNTAAVLSPATSSGSGPFTWAIGVGPPSGTATIDAATGAMVFTPAPGAAGIVTYTFVVTDQYGTASAPATATVRVTTTSNSKATTDTPQAPDAGAHLLRQALQGGALMVLGLLLLLAAITTRRRRETASGEPS
ncbi:MAG: tandem-95 repeat protein [Candidatus Dormibacteria bacterium]